MATLRAGERLVVPGHPQYEPAIDFRKLVEDAMARTAQCLMESEAARLFDSTPIYTAESAHLKPYDGVAQDDGWDY